MNAESVELELGGLNEFEQWLKSHDDKDIVGVVDSTESCPIANFLKTKTTQETRYEVGFDSVRWIVCGSNNCWHWILLVDW